MTIKLRLVVSVLAILAVALGALVTVISSRNSSAARTAAVRYAEELSARSGAQAHEDVSSALATARDLSQTLGALSSSGATRAQADAAERALLAAHPPYLGVWSVWEPQAFDRQDASFAGREGLDAKGRFTNYWYRDGSAIAVEALTDYATADYYQASAKSGQERVIDPYSYELSGQKVLMTSATAPILRDGKVVGVAGVDLALTALQGRVDAIKPYGTGRAVLLSSSGLVVASGAGDKALQRPAADVAALAGSSVTNGRTISRTVSSSHGDLLKVATPLTLGAKDTWSLVITVPADTVLAEANRLRNLSIGLAFVALLAAGLLTLVLARSVVRPIEQLRDRLAEIADGDGDLTQRMDETRRDEAGELSAAFNRFVAKVADTVRAISTSAGSLTSSAEQLSGVADGMRSGAQRASDQATDAAGMADQVTIDVQSIATGAEQMSSSIAEIASGASQAADVAREAVEVAAETGRQIDALGTASAEIDSVVALITTIAEQTNLLALNATIEAARAVDAGKGFAVVAGEVKELARQTARATGDITSKILALQSSTGGAAKAIARIHEVIGQINDFSATIASAVEEQSATTAEMTRASSEAASSSARIAETVTGVAAATTTTSEGASTTQDAASDLNRLAGELRDLVQTFKV